MPSKKKTRNYKAEYEKSLERRAAKPGALDAERERLKHAQRKRRANPDAKKRDREGQRNRIKSPERLAKHREYFTEWRHKRVQACQEIIYEWKRQGCCVCAESALCCIDAHHKNQKEKDHNIGKLVYGAKVLTTIPKELAKCIPICANCHRKYHDGSDKAVVAAVVAITGQPWSPVLGGGVPSGKKKRNELNRLGPFGKPIYNDMEEFSDGKDVT